jgi:hypothetical protein
MSNPYLCNIIGTYCTIQILGANQGNKWAIDENLINRRFGATILHKDLFKFRASDPM